MNAISNYLSTSNVYTSNKKEVSVSVSAQVTPVERIQRDDAKKVQLDTSTEQQKPTRFDVDEQAIAFFEEQGLVNTASDNASSSNQSSQRATYDNPSEQNQTAISAYQNVDNIANKASIEKMFGVDLYA